MEFDLPIIMPAGVVIVSLKKIDLEWKVNSGKCSHGYEYQVNCLFCRFIKINDNLSFMPLWKTNYILNSNVVVTPTDLKDKNGNLSHELGHNMVKTAISI